MTDQQAVTPRHSLEVRVEGDEGLEVTGSSHSQNRHKKKPRLTPEEIAYIHGHPDMTAREVAEHLPGRSESSVANARKRKRHGRLPQPSERLCVVCDERVVWAESPRARAMRMCKGCYLREMELRDAEELRSNAVRQRIHKARYGKRRKR